MSRRSVLVTSFVFLALLLGAAGVRADGPGPAGPAVALGSAFTYQGQLQSGGQPVSGNCDMGFRLYGQGSGGAPVAGVLSQTVAVTNSLFTVALDFGAGAFDGSARWLDVTLRCPAGSGAFAHLDPRQALTAAPYALYARNTGALAGQPLGGGAPASGQVLKWNGSAWVPGTDNTSGGGGAWLLASNAGTSPANFLGTTDNMTLTLVVSGSVAMRFGPNASSPNIIGGYSGNIISPTVSGVVIAGGGGLGFANSAGADFATVSGGYGNHAGGPYNTLGGGIGNATAGQHGTVSGGFANQAISDGASIGGGDSNTASGALSTVAGGGANQATQYGATVSGGGSNTASGLYVTVGGGNGNIASGPGATIGGGGWDGTSYGGNHASGQAATIGGGITNTANGNYATVSGGWQNWAGTDSATVAGGNTNNVSGLYGVIGGGQANTASANDATIAGGNNNLATGQYATISGGDSNVVSGTLAVVGGGGSNQATQLAATVGGGGNNKANDQYASVGGGNGNVASGRAAVVGGGIANQASNQYATIGGGSNNYASGLRSTVGGGTDNKATVDDTTVGGGNSNTATGILATVAGGSLNQATQYGAAVGGGASNTASNAYATVVGGNGNTASGPGAFIGGGGWDGATYLPNTVNGAAGVVAGGVSNSASNSYSTVGGGKSNTASGIAATVAGGFGNTANGLYSFAAGRSANAAQDGTFVWANSTGAVLTSTTANQFLVRASGGVTIYSNSAASVGAQLAPGSGSWSSVSDRNLKANFATVDDLSVLEALAAIPMQTWNYQTQDAAIRHLGPMAQDFRAAFGLGENDTTISTVDAQGVALAGVQGLYHLAQAQAAQLQSQQAQIDDLQARLSGAQPAGNSSPLSLGWMMFGGLLLLNLGGVAGYVLARGRRNNPSAM